MTSGIQKNNFKKKLFIRLSKLVLFKTILQAKLNILKPADVARNMAKYLDFKIFDFGLKLFSAAGYRILDLTESWPKIYL
jgi:hypothetical protein